MILSKSSETRRLAAIVVFDVVGYSRMMRTDESGTLGALKGHQRDFINPMIAAFHGRLIKTTGDGFLCEFGSIIDASLFAVSLQQGMVRRNVDVDASRRVEFRVGVNIGDIIVQDGDIFGDGVNVAARLEKLSEVGAICMSRAAYEQIRHATGLPFVDIGLHVVKSIAQPLDVVSLSASALAALPQPSPNPFAKPGRLGPHRFAVIASCLVAFAAAGAGGAYRLQSRSGAPDLKAQLEAVLATQLTNSTNVARSRLIANYLSTPLHRSFAVAPTAKSRWYTGDWPTRKDARTKGLERCQVVHGEPCALVGLDDELVAQEANGSRPVFDMPRAHYAGPFDPSWIPGIRLSTTKRPEVQAYGTASAPKAIAYHARGLLFVVTAAASQNEAETTALKTCNASAKKNDIESPCLLYAVDNRVVLPEHRTVPVTAPNP